MNELTKQKLLEMLLKLLQTDRGINFLLSLEEKDLKMHTFWGKRICDMMIYKLSEKA